MGDSKPLRRVKRKVRVDRLRPDDEIFCYTRWHTIQSISQIEWNRPLETGVFDIYLRDANWPLTSQLGDSLVYVMRLQEVR